MSEDFTVTLSDMRSLGYCCKGTRALAQRYGIDWDDFIKNGIPASRLLALDNHFATEAVRIAKLRRGGESIGQ